MKFGSVCSGIEAASVAWEPLGWKAAWFSEIEPFPSAVLAHHYPNTPNLGDMTTLPSRITSGEVEAPDLFCGGTPCQAFSVAGLRKSLDDVRGNLSLMFCEIANAIDNVRAARGESASIVFWENVPGVLSTADNAFGCFLAGLAGEGLPLLPPGGRWTNAGCVLGPQRAVAWRILDAQYFGVAQRRRRVFVVASARNDFNPAKVLFEWEGLRRDSAPSRETGKASAARTGFSVERGSQQPYAVANCLTARMHKGINSTLDEGQTPVVQPVGFTRCDHGGDAVIDGTPTMRCGSNYSAHLAVAQPVVFGMDGDVMQHGLMETVTTREGNITDTAHAVVQPIAFHPTQDPISSTAVCHSIGANENATAAVAQPMTLRPDTTPKWNEDIAFTLTQPSPTGGGHPQAVIQHMAVRRLTPVECERLQGFPDNYTAIPWRKKPADQCPDGPRYKALGNSWAVPNVRWIGNRINTEIKCKPKK